MRVMVVGEGARPAHVYGFVFVMSQQHQQNYYELLGLPRSATEQQIRAAYRSLAVKHHPDTSKDKPDAAAAFKHITEAYDVLSDPVRRRSYDRLLSPIRRSQSPVPSSTWKAGASTAAADAEDNGTEDNWAGTWLDPLDAIFAFLKGPIPHASSARESHVGQARVYELELPLTPEEARYGARLPLTLTTREICQRCRRSGEIPEATCEACGGQGLIHRPRRMTVDVPSGVVDGAILRWRPSGSLSGSDEFHLRIRIRPSW
jgi:DnaJ-class molecular chaperone